MTPSHPPPGTWNSLAEPLRPTPSPVAPTQRQPMLGKVKCVFDQSVCVVFPDGSEALCENRVFPGLRPHYPVFAYPDGDVAWSLHDPGWFLFLTGAWALARLAEAFSFQPGAEQEPNQKLLRAFRRAASECLPTVPLTDDTPLTPEQWRAVLAGASQHIGKPVDRKRLQQLLTGLTCGDLVPFRITHADPNDPQLLHGTVLGKPAVAHRKLLPFPKCLPIYPAELLALDPTLQWRLADPTACPLLVARCLTRELEYTTVTGQNHPCPGLFLLALRDLLRRLETIPGLIHRVDGDFLSLSLYGVNLRVYPEQCCWSRSQTVDHFFREGQEIQVAAVADLEGFAVDTSLLPVDGPEWKQALQTFSEQSVVHNARHVLTSRHGLVVELPCSGLAVRGLIPFGELAEGNDPFSHYNGELQEPLTVLVRGLDVLRRRLDLSWRLAQPTLSTGPRLETGQVIPVEVVLALPGFLWVRWAPGKLTAIQGEGLPAGGCWWAQVETTDPAGRQPRLRLCQMELDFVVTAVADDTFKARPDNKPEVTLFRRPPFEGVAVGDRLQPCISSIVHYYSGPVVVASQLADYQKLCRPGASRECLVTVRKCIKGGLEVDLGGHKGFLPASQVDLRHPPDLNALVGKELLVQIVKIPPEHPTLIVSRRALLESQQAEQKKVLLAQIEPGQIRGGVVKNIAPFGVFVDLGGLDGLMHISDMSWDKVTDPHQLVHLEQQLEVFVISVDKEKEKIALGLKQKTLSPFASVSDKYPVNSRHTGEVVNVMSYGAFVKLAPGIEGLVHISEMSWTKRINHPNELVQIGDRIEVQILNINKTKEEISLGMKQVQPDPWSNAAERYPPNTVITGVVRNLTNYGAFIEIEEGIDGLLHISDMSWVRKVAHPSEVVSKGDKVTCVVLNVDQERKRIGLGLKQMNNDPWEGDIPGRYRAGEIKKGKVTKLTNFGVFVELDPGLEGLLHISELADHKVESPKDVVKVGDELEVKILRVDAAERKIGLSRKQLLPAPVATGAPLPNEAGDGSAPEFSAAGPTEGPAPEPSEQLALEPLVGSGNAPELPARTPESPHGTSESTSTSDAEPALPPALKWTAPAVVVPAPPTPQPWDSAVRDWLEGSLAGSDALTACAQQGFHALASLVRFVDHLGDAPPWTPPPRWATLTRLLDLGFGTDSPPRLTAAALDMLLRLLVANPAELLVWEALAEVLPPTFVPLHHDHLRRWLGRQGIAPENCRIGLALLRTHSLRRQGKLEEAFAVLNPIANDLWDNGLLAERNQLVKEFEKQLGTQTSFFDRFDRARGVQAQKGAFAMVIPVCERSTNKLFALKHYLLRNLTPNEMDLALELFAREAEFLRQIRHPNVIALHEVLPSKGCILLEWFRGKNLRLDENSVGRQEAWPEPERALDLGYRVASALHAVSRVMGKEFVHNDLHPGNLMIDATDYQQAGWVKVIDFGLSSSPRFFPLSTVVDDLEVRLQGPYRAPEVAEREFGSPATDMFSLGVILFQLLTGCLPHCKVDDPPHRVVPVDKVFGVVPQPVGRLLSRMLAPNPSQRPGDWEEVKQELAPYLPGRPLDEA